MKLFYPLKNCFLLSLFFIATIFLTSAQNKTISNGLVNFKTNTSLGAIYIYLPENYVSDMPISGSLFIEPKGSSAKEIQKNKNKLLNYSLQLGESSIQLKDKIFTAIMKSDQIKLSILDNKGKLVETINTNLLSKIQPKTFNFPEGVKSEGRTQIIGSFDGRMNNTSITINGQNANILAESPIQSLIKSPKLSTGVYKIQVKENNKTIAEGTTQLVNYVLTAGKLNLKKGQNTHILATITGLNFLEKPIPLTVKNMTPLVVFLQGGNSQKIMIPKQNETYTKRWNIRSIKSGSFIIDTELKLPNTKFPKENLALANNKEDEIPCKELKKSCDELLADLNDKIALSDKAQKTYDIDKFEADKLNEQRSKLEANAKKSEKDASPADESETITYEGYTYKLADSRLLKVLRDDAYQDYKDGKTDINKYQKRVKELSTKKALKEVEKNRKELEKKLEEIAKKAREDADAIKISYDKATAKAKVSKEINKQRLSDVWAAQRAYDACIKMAKDKCEKVLADKLKKELKEKEILAKLPPEPTYFKEFASLDENGNAVCEEGKIRWKALGSTTTFEWKLPKSPIFKIKSDADHGYYKVPGSENFLGQLSELFSAFDLITSENKKRALGELTISKTSEFPIVTSPMGYASAISKIGDRAVKAVDRWMKKVDTKDQYLQVKVDIEKVIIKCAPVQVCRSGNWVDDGLMSVGRFTESKLNTIEFTGHLNRNKDLKGQMRIIMGWYNRKSKVWSDFQLNPCR